MKKKYIFTALSILLFLNNATASHDSFFGYEPEIINAFHSGNDKALYESIEKFLLNEPDSIFAPLFYSDLGNLAASAGYQRVESALRKLIETIEDTQTVNSHTLKLLLMLQLEKLYYSYKPEKAAEITTELNPIRAWRLEGPFRRYGASDIHERFPPEINFLSSDSGVKRFFLENSDGVLRLENYLFPPYGTAYALTSFKTAEPVKLRIYSNSEYHLYINGRKIIENIAGDFSAVRIIKIRDTKQISLMLKSINLENPEWHFRVIVTGHDGRPAEYSTDRTLRETGPVSFSEVKDPPFDELMRYKHKNPERAATVYFYLANMLKKYESSETEKLYRKSLEIEYSIYSRYFYAVYLMDSSEKGTPRYRKGRAIISDLVREEKSFIPPLNRYFHYYLEAGDLPGAYRRAAETLDAAPLSLSAHNNFISLLLNLDYERETLEKISNFRKLFQKSHRPLLLKSEFYKNRNVNKYIDLNQKIISSGYNRSACENLIDAYLDTGRYSEALKLAEKFNHNHIFTDLIIEALIRKEDYDSANRILVKKTEIAGLPSHYYSRFVIDTLSGIDDTFNISMAYLMNPSAFGLSDYINFIETGGYLNVFDRTTEPGYDNPRKLLNDGQNELSSVILSSKKYFMISARGANRVFAEKIIYVGDSRGVEKWGDYRIPFRGNFHPLIVRTLFENGDYSNTYSIQTIDGEHHINFRSVKPGSIIKLSYIVDNPLSAMRGSYLLSSPYIHAQNFEEPCNNFLLKIIAPESEEIYFRYNGSPEKTITNSGGKEIYSFRFTAMPEISSERFSGSSLLSLPYIAFSTIDSFDDFSTWYRGLLIQNRKQELILPAGLKAGTTRETAINVYNFITKEIESSRGPLYYPSSPENTMHSKKGTPEDKAVLMKAVLKQLDIKSHVAFTAGISLPDIEDFVSPSMFSDILLYVPEGDIWIDFSNRYYPAGITGSELNGRKAVVLTDNGYIDKEIISADGTLKKSSYIMKLNKYGTAEASFTAEFSGRYSEVKQYFRNTLYHDETINTYFSSIVSPFITDNYSVSNHDSSEDSLKLAARGRVPGFAIAADDRLVFNPVLNKSSVYRYVEKPERELPLVIYSDIIEHEEYIYHLPEGYYPSSKDISAELDSRYGSASIITTWNKNTNTLKLTKKLNIHSARISPEHYPGFLDFCMKLKNIEENTVVLKP